MTDKVVVNPTAAAAPGPAVSGSRPPEAPKLLPHKLLGTSYFLERLYPGDRVKRFLEIFGAVLKYTNYGHLVDTYARVGAKCANCACACQIYLATKDPRDVPCYRTNLLLEIYRRHFTFRGMLQSKLTGAVYLTNEKISELAESVYHCTGCRRCSFECPHGDRPRADDPPRPLHPLGDGHRAEGAGGRRRASSSRERRGNTSAIPVAALLDTLEFLAGRHQGREGRARSSSRWTRRARSSSSSPR